MKLEMKTMEIKMMEMKMMEKMMTEMMVMEITWRETKEIARKRFQRHSVAEASTLPPEP